MAVDFQIFNAAGYLQFDAVSTPFCLYDKATFNTNDVGGPYTVGGNTSARNQVVFYGTTINLTKPNSIIAISGAAPACVLRQSGTSVTIAYQRNNANMTVYAFAKYSATPATGVGLEIRDANNALTFSSNDKPLKPVHFQQYQFPDQTNDPIMNYSNLGKTLAVVHNNTGLYQHFFDDYDSQLGSRYSERNIVMTFTTPQGGAFAAGYRRNRIKVGNATSEPDEYVPFVNGSATVVDVTNF